MHRRESELIDDQSKILRRLESSGHVRHLKLRSEGIGAKATGASAIGALAIGAVAFGAFAIGALAIGSLAIGRTRIRRIEIDDLVVRRLRITEEIQVPGKL